MSTGTKNQGRGMRAKAATVIAAGSALGLLSAGGVSAHNGEDDLDLTVDTVAPAAPVESGDGFPVVILAGVGAILVIGVILAAFKLRKPATKS